MKVYIIRHTTPDVPTGTCYGQTDVPLKATFQAEAQAVKDSIPDIKFDAVYSSPLSRCRFLATFCGYPTPRLDDRIKEINFGRWEMQLFEQIDDEYIQNWYDNFVDAPIPLIFAHGGVLACARVYAGLCDLHHAFENLIPFGGMLCIEL